MFEVLSLKNVVVLFGAVWCRFTIPGVRLIKCFGFFVSPVKPWWELQSVGVSCFSWVGRV